MEIKKTPIPVEEVVRRLGGLTETARLCKVTRQAVWAWIRRDQIPDSRLMFLQLARPGVFLDPVQIIVSPEGKKD